MNTFLPRHLSRVRLTLVLVVLAVVLLVGWGWHRAVLEAELLRLPPDAPADRPLLDYAVARARPLFGARCAGCHGAGMTGDRRTGVPDLTDREWLYGDGRVPEIEQTILYGIRSGHHRAHDLADMPAFGTAHPYRRYALPTFTPAQIGDVADYVQALQHRRVDPAAVGRGKLLFDGPGQCYDCHTSDATGDNFAGAPSLVDRVWLHGAGTRADIVRSVSGGQAGVCPAWVGRLTPAEIKALAVTIHAVATGRDHV